MENLKIRVSSEAESKEVQELFFKLGFQWRGLKSPLDLFYPTSMDNYYILLTKGSKEMQIAGAFRDGLRAWKEITLPELRAMANPVKEYLVKNIHDQYVLVDHHSGFDVNELIEIPDGAEIAAIYGSSSIEFYKESKREFFNNLDKVWQSYKGKINGAIVWQREQDEPFLTPESTLNDQYAEIEQVRQVEIHGTVKAEPDLNFGAAQASGGAKMRENNHYFIDVSDVDEVDFYEIAKRYNVADPAIQHILKKCLAIGNRGHKDLETDLKDILKTAKRALQINGFGE